MEVSKGIVKMKIGKPQKACPCSHSHSWNYAKFLYSPQLTHKVIGT